MGGAVVVCTLNNIGAGWLAVGLNGFAGAVATVEIGRCTEGEAEKAGGGEGRELLRGGYIVS